MGAGKKSGAVIARLAAFAMLVWVAGTAAFSGAQGVLLQERHWMPRPMPQAEDGSYRIRELSADASIRDQIATTQVTQVFENTGNVQIEATFCFPLPYDGAIDKMTFMVDGREIEAKLLKADEARRIYEGYVRQNKDPALLEWMGHGMFRSSVFPIPAGATRTVTLKYSQLLRRDRQLTDYVFPLALARYTSSPIEKVSLRVAIESQEKIRSIYSPTHNVDISRDDDFHAVVRHSTAQNVPNNDFRLVFDTAAGKVAASLMSYWPEGEDQGYFAFLASPELKADETDVSKTVIFVVDQSGSMSGEKIDQAREAARFVINNLREGDLFNVISYETAVTPMKPELQRFNAETRQMAIGFVNSINSGGSTNIDGALKTALGMLQNEGRPAYIVFLTDGLPTEGETDELKIAENARTANRYGARIISFGVGYDVNSRLLDRLTRENHGQSEHVRPDEDIEASVARLYGKISSPVLSSMTVDFGFDTVRADSGELVNRMYPKGVTDLFAGSQLVLIGRYRESGAVTVNVKGRVGDKEESFRFDMNLSPRGEFSSYGFVRQLWAARRIGEIIDLIDLNGSNQELIQELVELSTKHGIVTPYTSYLADENQTLARLANFQENFGEASENLSMLSESRGEGAFEQRASKQAFKGAGNMESADLAAAMPAGGLGGAGGGGLGGQTAGQQLGQLGVPDMDHGGDSMPASQGLRKVGNVTLYVRGQTVVAENAASVDLEKEKDSIVELKQFSDGYFELVTGNTAEENLILAEQREGETLVVSLRGKTYRITP